MNVTQGNAKNIAQDHQGWFIGHFMDKDSPLYTENVEVKWIARKKDILKKGLQTKQDVHTLLLLVSGKIALRFPSSGKQYVLSKEGDFISFYAKDDAHTTETLEDTKAMVIKWPSLRGESRVEK
jgi:hypothetical protein